jgi:hypothetical protein
MGAVLEEEFTAKPELSTNEAPLDLLVMVLQTEVKMSWAVEGAIDWTIAK